MVGCLCICCVKDNPGNKGEGEEVMILLPLPADVYCNTIYRDLLTKRLGILGYDTSHVEIHPPTQYPFLVRHPYTVNAVAAVANRPMTNFKEVTDKEFLAQAGWNFKNPPQPMPIWTDHQIAIMVVDIRRILDDI